MESEALRNCCVCGTRTTHTLSMHLRREAEIYVVELTPVLVMEGYPGVVHGGYSSLLLDEVMAVAVGLERHGEAVTQRLTVEFVKPVLLGQLLRVEAWFVKPLKGHFYKGAGQILDAQGQCLVRAEGEFGVMSARVRERLFRHVFQSER